MEIFSAMAGTEDKIEEQNATSETPLSGDSPTLSYSSREVPTQKSRVEEIDIRLRVFKKSLYSPQETVARSPRSMQKSLS